MRVLRNGATATSAFSSGRSGLRSGLLAVMAVTDRIRTTGSGGAILVRGRMVQPRFRSYTPAEYRAHLHSISLYRMLDDDRRETVIDDTIATIEAHGSTATPR